MSRKLIELAFRGGALMLAEKPSWLLRSLRMSPYFFDGGKFATGSVLGEIGEMYAKSLLSAQVAFDVVYGPPYKGTLLAEVTVVKLLELNGMDVGYSTSRILPKDYSEGGTLMGASLKGKRVVILDDTITEGGTMRAANERIRRFGGTPVRACIAFDRQERTGNPRLSAVREVERDLGIPVTALATLAELMNYLKDQPHYVQEMAAIERYQNEYGVSGPGS